MSSKSTSPKNNTILGKKTTSPNDFDLINSKEEDKKQKSKDIEKCHYCQKNQFKQLKCIKCGNSFCTDCSITLYKDKDKFEKIYNSNEEKKEKNNWICFICNEICNCKNCQNVLKDKNEKKCLLCQNKTNPIKINDMLNKLNLTEQKKADYINQKNSISIILSSQLNDKYICNACFQNNLIVKKFLQGEIIKESQEKDELQSNNQTQKKQLNNNINNLQPNSEEKKDDPSSNQKQLPINQAQTILNLLQQPSSQKQQMPQNIFPNQQPPFSIPPFMYFQQPPPPDQKGINQDNLIPGLNMLQRTGSFQPDGQTIPPMFCGLSGQTTQQQNQEQPYAMNFPKIVESLKNYNEYNNQKNMNLYSNANQLKSILNTMINETKKGEDEEGNSSLNKENSSTMISYIMTIIEDLNNQIGQIQYYTQIQQYFLVFIRKNLEIFMEQVKTQQNDFPKAQMLKNQIPPGVFPPFAIQNNQMMNDLFKMQFQGIAPNPLMLSDMQGNPLMNDIMKHMQFQGMNPPMMGGVPTVPGVPWAKGSPASGTGGGINANPNPQQNINMISNLMNITPSGMGNIGTMPQNIQNMQNMLSFMTANKKNFEK